jgi:hypothetical protein
LSADRNDKALHEAGPFHIDGDCSASGTYVFIDEAFIRLERLRKIQAIEKELVMKALIARQLYQPAVILPLLLLTRLMVTLDFNLTQVMFVVVLKGSQQAWHLVLQAARHVPLRRSNAGDVEHIACRNCC